MRKGALMSESPGTGMATVNFDRPPGGLDGQTPYERLLHETKTLA